MNVIETDRLVIRRMTADDAAFIFELVNDPAWLQFIGDRGVHDLDDARNYILTGPMAMYDRCGFGLYLVVSKDEGAPLGICGLIRRDALDDVDLGFAFLPAFRGRGFASESAAAVLGYGRRAFGLRRIVAITSPDNVGSIMVLERLGFRFERMMRMPGEDEDVRLFAHEA